MALYAFSQDLPRGANKTALRYAHRLGLLHQGDSFSPVSQSLSIRPVIDYDTNVNGGSAGNIFTLGIYDFTLNKDTVAQAGLVLGAAVSASKAWSFAEGSTVKVTGHSSQSKAPKLDMSISNNRMSACAAHFLGQWTWVNNCLSYSTARRELTNSKVTTTSLGLNKVFGDKNSVHELSFDVKKAERASYNKNAIDFGWNIAAKGIGALRLGAEFSENIEGLTTHRRGANASLTTLFDNKPITFGLSVAEYSGGKLFGQPRDDRHSQIFVNRTFKERLSVTLSWVDAASSISTFDESYWSMKVNFVGWQLK